MYAEACTRQDRQNDRPAPARHLLLLFLRSILQKTEKNMFPPPNTDYYYSEYLVLPKTLRFPNVDHITSPGTCASEFLHYNRLKFPSAFETMRFSLYYCLSHVQLI